MPQVATVNVLGTPVARVTYQSAFEVVQDFARESRPTAVCPSNTHILSEARHDPEFARVMSRFDLVFPDGVPVVWAMNLRGAGLSDRVYGPYFTKYVLERTPRPWRHFFFGDTDEVLEALKRAAVQLQPNIDIVGTISPPFRAWTESDEAQFAETINNAAPDFVWVALAGGRMERWIAANQHRYKRGVFLAVGDAFTLISGRRPFAPKWMQQLGLTWLFRMAKEPRRLGPRYLRYNSLFLYYLVRDSLLGAPARDKGR
ncbi:MAG TPA: WecB/TagA/CpsF family glycosyltransferase [Chthoniobacterales bacterium]|jgi:N-acetylglucosaminyldiphosphoundecaprenol N-acetyl-beta-D-mannosaminyltransferase|nr:WecB/TagA/CpsF family glycosyltransferase [Chthoniobacterales bacterium]